MTGKSYFQEYLPNADIVFGSCQVLICLAVAFVLGRGVGFRVVICEMLSVKPVRLLTSKIEGESAYPLQPCLRTQRTSSRVPTLLAPWF